MTRRHNIAAIVILHEPVPQGSHRGTQHYRVAQFHVILPLVLVDGWRGSLHAAPHALPCSPRFARPGTPHNLRMPTPGTPPASPRDSRCLTSTRRIFCRAYSLLTSAVCRDSPLFA